ncbi:MAG: hypothetical protein IKW04_03720 [Clostridia bacterium]|nr:hypothetical protein [Clostridia bacterium]
MSKKNPVVLLVSAIIAFVLAVGGLYYSSTDNAKIVGKWNAVQDDSYNSYSSAVVSETVELTIFGKLTQKRSYESGTSFSNSAVNATYSVEAEDHVLVIGSGTSSYSSGERGYASNSENGKSSPTIGEYHFVNGNQEIVLSGIGSSSLSTYKRADAIPFYVLMQILSVILAVVGGILLKKYLKQKKYPAAPAPYTPGYGAPVAPASYAPGYGAPAAPAPVGPGYAGTTTPPTPDNPIVPGDPYNGVPPIVPSR